jgi:hypothetical protein
MMGHKKKGKKICPSGSSFYIICASNDRDRTILWLQMPDPKTVQYSPDTFGVFCPEWRWPPILCFDLSEQGKVPSFLELQFLSGLSCHSLTLAGVELILHVVMSCYSSSSLTLETLEFNNLNRSVLHLPEQLQSQ